MGRSHAAGRRRRRVVLAVVIIAVLVVLLAVASSAGASSTPSPDSGTAVPADAAASQSHGSSVTGWVIAGVVAFLGAAVVVWLRQRAGGRPDDE